MHFLEPQLQNFLGEAPGPPVKGGSPPPCGLDKTTTCLSISIARRLLKVIFPLLAIFERTLHVHVYTNFYPPSSTHSPSETGPLC